MKDNVIYTSGLFKFLPNGWPEEPSTAGQTMARMNCTCDYCEAIRKWELAKAQALKDAVVFADQYLGGLICDRQEQHTNREMKMRMVRKSPYVYEEVKEGQTFYVEGVEIKSVIHTVPLITKYNFEPTPTYKLVATLSKPPILNTKNEAIYEPEPCKVSGETQEELAEEFIAPIVAYSNYSNLADIIRMQLSKFTITRKQPEEQGADWSKFGAERIDPSSPSLPKDLGNFYYSS